MSQAEYDEVSDALNQEKTKNKELSQNVEQLKRQMDELQSSLTSLQGQQVILEEKLAAHTKLIENYKAKEKKLSETIQSVTETNQNQMVVIYCLAVLCAILTMVVIGVVIKYRKLLKRLNERN